MTDEDRTDETKDAGEHRERGPRRLFRSRRDRVLGGVAGGLGRYFGLDPIFFRIGFAALAFLGGTGFILYGLAWLFVPEEGGTAVALDLRRRGRLWTLLGAVALGIAALAALDSLFGFDGWAWGIGGFFGTLLVIAIVGALVWRGLQDRPRDGTGVDAGWFVRRAALAIAILAGATLLFLGSAVAAAAGGGVAIAAIVILIGVMLVVAAFRGGARWLILPALLMAIPVGVVSAADVDLDGGVGERNYQPGSVADLRDTYKLGVGRLEVDLRDLELPPGDRRLHIDLGVGEAVVIVPNDVCVALDSRVGAGYARLFDRDSAGADVNWGANPQAPPRAPHLVLDADVGMGALQIVHDSSDLGGQYGPEGDVSDSEGNTGCERSGTP